MSSSFHLITDNRWMSEEVVTRIASQLVLRDEVCTILYYSKCCLPVRKQLQ